MNRKTRLLTFWLCQQLLAAQLLFLFPAIGADSDDVLSPGDRVLITIYEQGDLTTETEISDSGEIEFPLIGTVKLGGKTIKDAVAELTNQLSQGFVVDPKVTLTITGAGIEQAIVIGMVVRPGAVDFPPKRPLDLLSAIGMAGGFAPGADLSRVSIRREVGGKPSLIKISDEKLTGDDPELIMLKADDVVSVGQAFAQRVTVMGAVTRPGFVEIPDGGALNLLSAIALASGYTDDADASSVVVRRGLAIHRIDAEALAHRSGSNQFIVQPGDVVTVDKLTLRTVTIMGEIKTPGVIEIPATSNLNLLDAVALAGGYTGNANPKRIVVRRQGSEGGDGKDKFYRIDGKRLAGDANAKPFHLKSGDLITVGERFF